MAANKTTETKSSVPDYLAKIVDAGQRADAAILVKLLKRVSRQPPKMWGPSIVGFGSYHYRYESGREGIMCRIGFSPRKGNTVIYVNGGFPNHAKILAKLGKYKTSGGCLHIKHLSDVNLEALEQLCAASFAYMAKKYPATD